MSKKEKVEKNVQKECDCQPNNDCSHKEESSCEECSCEKQPCEEISCEKQPCEECSCDECHEDEQISVLNNYIKELEEKILREKAELVNYRRRKDDEVSNMLKYANEDVIGELLPIVDNFERAIKLDNNDLSDELSKFLTGFKMIYTSLINVLNKFEVKAIDGTSKPFDPTYHQAVLTEKIEGVEPGIVIEVLQKGYLYKDRVIRPAMVKVSE